MKKISIDETKLPAVMEIIEKTALLMDEKDCDSDKEAKKELGQLQKNLREVTGNKKIKINIFQAYWSYTDLETIARRALMSPPMKSNLTNEQLKEIVLHITDFEEDEMDWWLEYLEINTGLDNLTDYIFYPNFFGLELDAALEQIADKIIEDRK